MGKAEYGTPKYIAKQIKSKGLQKLKFYCQVCAKQCRDANGFKAHVLSPSHNRNMAEQTGSKKLGEFTRSFEKDFLRLLRLAHGTKKVNANRYYQEYILNDRDHVHLNATRFSSLSQFVHYLEQNGKIEILRDAPDDDTSNMQTLDIKLVGEDPRVKIDREKQEAERTEEDLKMENIQRALEKNKQELERIKELAKQAEKTEITQGESAPVKFSLKKKPAKDLRNARETRKALGFKLRKAGPS